MPKKSYSRTGGSCRVQFELPTAVNAKKASLVGDFNDWNPKAHPMKAKKDGTFYVAVHLAAGAEYRYRYLLDGKRWENDWEADMYLPNEHGTDDSIVIV
jgi:1,4-alpha-glucan branching enzyme